MPPPIDIHAARDMTLPGLVSQDLIRQGDEWWKYPALESGEAAASG